MIEGIGFYIISLSVILVALRVQPRHNIDTEVYEDVTIA